MPGIAGIISQKPAAQCQALVESMIDSMKHEPFYATGTCLALEMGIVAGWVTMEGGFAAKQVFSNPQRDVLLIFAGECFPDSTAKATAHRNGGGAVDLDTHWLVSLYEREGIQFVEKLNGLFSGLLIDKRQRKAFLFNDRYGIERIYWAETPAGFFFASEVKAILRVLPEFRAFDEEGVAHFLNFGCAVEWRTLFKNVHLLPGGSCWTFHNGDCQREKYFKPETLEEQPTLTTEEFEVEFQQTFKRILPRYFESDARIGISLTGGLDTRMIMACRPEGRHEPVCYTYSGETVDTLDARLAARIAGACGLDHHILHVQPDFFSDFGALADRTVYVTDGYFGVTGAHEIYMSRQARQLAPVRLTGNYGGEVFRGVSTFKPMLLADGLVSADLSKAMEASAERLDGWKENQITFAAFREVPWNLFGNLMAGRSQLRFRTPYLDNEIVALAYRAPEILRRSRRTAIRLVRENHPVLTDIPTDKGHLGNLSAVTRTFRRIFAEVTFKLDHINNEGFPNWLSPLDPVFQRVGFGAGIMGLHKHLHYRSWFRHELADYVKSRLTDAQTRQNPYWNSSFLEGMANDHIRGRKNYVAEINAVLTLDAVSRLLAGSTFDKV